MNIAKTEEQNQNTLEIDRASVEQAIRLINDEDKTVAFAVEKAIPEITKVTENVVENIRAGGRLFYIGTGTSGRLGVLDSTEIPPTFGVSPEMIQGVIAGGYDALHKAVEASEDDFEASRIDLLARGFTKDDCLIGIAASGNTPYTVGAVEFARGIGCFTGAITCNPESKLTAAAEVAIVVETGAEALTGSTRMKAGTAQKLVLNLISTVTMIKLGYVKGNRMTNLKPSNTKLKDRSLRILANETGLPLERAAILLNRANGDLRLALVVAETNAEMKIAEKALQDAEFRIEDAIKSITLTSKI
ncbi:MAG: N-acetylmuramic acid 6-phosphate etherase [Pyrinomonadaceae bacterium]